MTKFPVVDRILTGVAFAVLGAQALLWADPGSAPDPSQALIDRYLAASANQREVLKAVSMDVEIDASLPKLKKEGKMYALKYISRLGRITYDAVRFVGDNTVKKEVIARFLQAETQATDGAAMALTPDNYRFKFKETADREGRRVHIFDVTPKKKRLGLFKGQLWLDEATCMPIREAGRLVKNPSVFIKRAEFIRDYEIRDGVALPKEWRSFADTRLVGRAEVNIHFRNITPGERPDKEPSALLQNRDSQ